MAYKLIDIRDTSIGKELMKLNDSNKSRDIKKAGLWDLLDALSGKDNSKFSKAQAKKEIDRRGGI